MSRIKNYLSFKIIASLLVLTFISLDLAWAYPPDDRPQNNTLAAQGAFQREMMTDAAARFQRSLFNSINLMVSVCSIAKYLLADEFSLRFLEPTLKAELGNALEGIDLSRVTLKDGVVFIPCERGGKKYVIQVALKGSLAERDLVGYEWVIDDKYVVKAVPEDYEEPAIPVTPKAEPAKKAEVVVTETIAEVSAPADEAREITTPKRTFSIRAIIVKALLTMTMALAPIAAWAATSDPGKPEAETFFKLLRDSPTTKPVLEIMLAGIVLSCLAYLFYRVFFAIWRICFPISWNIRRLHSDKDDDAKESLIKIGPPAVPALIKTLQKRREDALARSYAAQILGKVKDPRALEPLKKALTDKESVVRRSAALALESMGWEPSGSDEAVLFGIAKQDKDILVALGSTAVPRLIETLTNRKWGARRFAADVLGEIKDFRATEPLIACLADKDVNLRCAAAQAVININDPRAGPLIKILKRYSTFFSPVKKRYVALMLDCVRNGKAFGVEYVPAVTRNIPDYDSDTVYTVVDFPPRLRVTKVREPSPSANKSNFVWRAVKRFLGWPSMIAIALAPVVGQAQDFSGRSRPGEISGTTVLIFVGAGVFLFALLIIGIALEPWLEERRDARKAKRLIKNIRAGDDKAVEELLDHTFIGYENRVGVNTDDRINKIWAGRMPPDISQRLINVVNDKSSKNRIRAIRVLRNKGEVTPEVEACLVTILRDEDSAIVSAAANTLRKMHIANAVEPLFACLRARANPGRRADRCKDKDEAALRSLIGALAYDLDYRPAAGIFVGLLKDRDRDVRREAACALDHLKLRPKTQDYRIAYCIAKGDWDGLAAFGEPAHDQLERLLRDQDEPNEERIGAIQAIENIKSPRSAIILARALEVADRGRGVWGNIAESVGRLKDPGTVEHLIRAMDRAEYGAGDIAKILGEMGDRRAIRPLVRLLGRIIGNRYSYYHESTSEVLEALGKIVGPAAVEPLTKVVKESEFEFMPLTGGQAELLVHCLENGFNFNIGYIPALTHYESSVDDDGLHSSDYAAVDAPARISISVNDPRVIESLRAASQDQDANIRRAALKALREIERKPPAVAQGVKKPRIWHIFSPMWWYLGRLKSAESDVRAEAEKELTEMGARVVPALIEIMRINTYQGRPISPEMKRSAAKILGDIKDPRAVRPLGNALLYSYDESVCIEAVKALWEIKDPCAIEVLTSVLRNDARNRSPEVRAQAAFALGAIGDLDAVDPLLAALKDGDSQVRSAAAYALGFMKDPSTIEALKEALKDRDGGVRANAILALGEIGGPALTELFIQTLSDNQACNWAAEVLQEVLYYNPRLKPLSEYLKYARWASVEEAASLTDSQAELIIRRLREREDFRVEFTRAKTERRTEGGTVVLAPAKVYVVTDDGLSTEPEEIIASVRREVEGRGEVAMPDLFTIVQTRVPASMTNLRKALAILKPYAESGVLTDWETLNVIADATNRFPLPREQERILRIAMLGFGQGMGEMPAADRVTSLFELVGSTANNNRARLVKAGNEVIAFLAESGFLPPTLSQIEREKTTLEVTGKLEQALAAVDGIKLPSGLAASALDIRKNINQLEADSIVSHLIILARKAMREGQKLIVGLETDWIPGYNERESLQRKAISPLIREILSLPQELRSMGLDNAVFISKNGSELASAILREAADSHTDLSNVVVLGSTRTINSDSFNGLRSTAEEKRAFLAGIDPAELERYYSGNRESTKQPDINITQLLCLALELAAGKEPPQNPLISSYDIERRIAIFLPAANPMDYDALMEIYRARKLALRMA